MSQEIIGRGWTFPPQINPRGGMSLTFETNELAQSIEVILSTGLGERVMRPHFGCRLHELVFAPINIQTLAQARRYVEQALGMWEPRIRVTQVIVSPDPNETSRLLVEIEYEIKTTRDRRSLVYPFYLIPGENDGR
jgi:uncharacterized protein